MGDRLFDELLPSTLLGALIASLGVVFFIVSRRPRSSIALSLAFVAFGTATALHPLFVNRVGGDATLLQRAHVGLEVSVMLAATVYASAIAATARTSPRARIIVAAGVRLAYFMAGVMIVLGIAFPRNA